MLCIFRYVRILPPMVCIPSGSGILTAPFFIL
jgi:hypothetical protein